MACGSWPRSGACVPWRSARLIGKTLTRPRRWRTPKAYLMGPSTTNRLSRVTPVSRSETKARLPLRLLAGTFGALLLSYLIHRAGPAKLLESMATLGWGVGLVIAWGGVSLVVKTWAWRLTLLDDKHRVSFGRMLGLRLSSEAVSHLGGLGQLCGDGLRASLLG